MIRNNVNTASGNLNTLTSGSVVGGPAVFMGNGFKKIANLSATLGLTAATATLTMAAKWQVSNDNSTWIDVANEPQNPAAVVITTGTATIVTKAMPAPDAIYGWQYARIAIVTGGTTGAAGDLYTIGYNYRQLSGAEAALG